MKCIKYEFLLYCRDEIDSILFIQFLVSEDYRTIFSCRYSPKSYAYNVLSGRMSPTPSEKWKYLTRHEQNFPGCVASNLFHAS